MQYPRGNFFSSVARAFEESRAARRADRSKASRIELTMIEGLIERVVGAAVMRRGGVSGTREDRLRFVACVVKGYLARLVGINQTWRILLRTDPRQVAYRYLFDGTRRAVLRVMTVYGDMKRRLKKMERERKVRLRVNMCRSQARH